MSTQPLQPRRPIKRALTRKLGPAVAAALALTATVAPIQQAGAQEPGQDAGQGADPITEVVIGDTHTWHYNDTGTNPGPTWNQHTEHQNWPTGQQQLGYGDGDETTIISYGPDPDRKHPAAYFATTINLTNVHQITNATATLTYDDAAALHLNGTTIHTTPNLPPNATHTTYATASGDTTITIPIDPTNLTNGTNTIAAQIHQAWRRSSDLSFNLTLTTTRQPDIPRPPTVIDDQAQTDEGIATGGDVAANDEAGLTYAIAQPIDPAIGTFTFDPTGTWTLQPAAGFLGTITVPHTGCDGAGVCADATLTIVVDELGDIVTEVVIGDTHTWHYNDTGTDPGPTWNQHTEHQNWPTGQQQLGYGDGDETTIISYGPDPDRKHPAAYFATTINLTNVHQITNATATLTYDDAAALHLNGTTIHTTPNLPPNATHTTYATASGDTTITIPIDPTNLTNGTNTIAAQIHQAWRRSSDLSFNLTLTTTRHILPGPPAPTVADDIGIAPPYTAITGFLDTNDRANDENPLSYVIAPEDRPDPAIGTLTLTGAFYAFTPAGDWTGTLTVPYSACNGPSCSQATLTLVTIDGPMDGPGAPTLASPGDRTIMAGEQLALRFEFDAVEPRFSLLGLPSGFSSDGSGLVTGSTTQLGVYPARAYLIDDATKTWAVAYVTVTVQDDQIVTLDLGHPDPIHVAPVEPVDLEIETAAEIAVPIQVTDGIISYRWLPPGMGGTIDGRILGTPTTAGSWTVAITVNDAAGNTGTGSVRIAVTAGPPPGEVVEQPAIDASNLDVRPEAGRHGVLGYNDGDSSAANVRVWDMQQIGAHMYVGGEFQQVQLGDGGAVVDQAFLARFDIATGAYDPSFIPVLDGNVHALEVAPRGVLLVGGEFTSIDGVGNTSGLAAIDPVTGQVDTAFAASVERPWSSNDPVIRELEVVGDLVYLAGNFSHLRDRASGKRERFYKAARVGADYGELDLTWRPKVTGSSVWGLGVDQDRGRVLLAGSFSSVDAVESSDLVAIVDTITGAVIPDDLPDSSAKIFDIEYGNDLIFIANGRNNQVSVHDADTFESIVEYDSDGDFQFLEKVGDYVYVGCHCTEDPEYPTVRILDAHTGANIGLQLDIGGNIEGAWTVATDDRGCAWIGGDIVDGGFDGARVWARGFATFCQQPPGAAEPVEPGRGGGDDQQAN